MGLGIGESGYIPQSGSLGFGIQAGLGDSDSRRVSLSRSLSVGPSFLFFLPQNSNADLEPRLWIYSISNDPLQVNRRHLQRVNRAELECSFATCHDIKDNQRINIPKFWSVMISQNMNHWF